MLISKPASEASEKICLNFILAVKINHCVLCKISGYIVAVGSFLPGRIMILTLFFKKLGENKITTQTGHCMIRNGTRGALSSVEMRKLETDCDPYTSFIAQNQEARQRNRSISFSDIIL